MYWVILVDIVDSDKDLKDSEKVTNLINSNVKYWYKDFYLITETFRAKDSDESLGNKRKMFVQFKKIKIPDTFNNPLIHNPEVFEEMTVHNTPFGKFVLEPEDGVCRTIRARVCRAFRARVSRAIRARASRTRANRKPEPKLANARQYLILSCFCLFILFRPNLKPK
jgi:hypothetical protein